jgi:hypothetical protein
MDRCAGDQQRAEASSREPGVAEHLFDREGAAGDVRGVLQQSAVAGHQRRRGEAEDLPKGEVPWHHRQDHAQRLIGDVALPRIRLHRFIGEEPLGVLGVEVAVPRALLYLRLGFVDRLAHLTGDQFAVAALPLA